MFFRFANIVSPSGPAIQVTAQVLQSLGDPLDQHLRDGAAAGIRTRVPGFFLLRWEAGVIDQADRQYPSGSHAGSGPRPLETRS